MTVNASLLSRKSRAETVRDGRGRSKGLKAGIAVQRGASWSRMERCKDVFASTHSRPGGHQSRSFLNREVRPFPGGSIPFGDVAGGLSGGEMRDQSLFFSHHMKYVFDKADFRFPKSGIVPVSTGEWGSLSGRAGMGSCCWAEFRSMINCSRIA